MTVAFYVNGLCKPYDHSRNPLLFPKNNVLEGDQVTKKYASPPKKRKNGSYFIVNIAIIRYNTLKNYISK